MADHPQFPPRIPSRAAAVARVIAEEARQRRDFREAERFEHIAAIADDRSRLPAQQTRGASAAS
jgi:hypothetical protein